MQSQGQRRRGVLAVSNHRHRLQGVMVGLVLMLAIAVDGSAVSVPGSSALVPHSTMSVVEEGAAAPGQRSNMIVSMVTYVKDSVVRTLTGCGQLYTNHNRCNEIRKKQKQYRETLRREWESSGLVDDWTPKQVTQRLQAQVGGISYDDYIFLERGKADRGKVLNLGFLMWGAPRFLPYALMFNPDMLPSPFQTSDKVDASASTAFEPVSRERAHAILSTLMSMEQQTGAVAAGGNSGNFLDIFSFFGKKKQAARKELLQTVVAETSQFFSSPTTSHDVLQRLAPYLYQSGTDFTRGERRLCQVPPCIVQGLGRAVAGQQGLPGIVAQVTPAFLHRGKLVGHLQKVAAADEFLVQSQIDLTTIPKRLLYEACKDRMITVGPHRSLSDLRTSLAEWLQQSTVQPSLAIGSSPNAALVPTTTTPPALQASANAVSDNDDPLVLSTAPPPPVYYNDNLARLSLMAYNACSAVCDSSCASTLPRLLCTSEPVDDKGLEHGTKPPRKGQKTKESSGTKSRIPLVRM